MQLTRFLAVLALAAAPVAAVADDLNALSPQLGARPGPPPSHDRGGEALVTAGGYFGTPGTGRLASAWPSAKDHVTLSGNLGLYEGVGLLAPGVSDRFVAGHLGAAWAFTEHAEVFMRMELGRHTHGTQPYSSGYGTDLFPGVRFSGSTGDFAFGLAGAANLIVGVNSIVFEPAATGFETRALFTYAPHALGATRPFRLHLNGGFILDNSNKLTERTVDPVYRYANRISAYDRLPLAASAELLTKRIGLAVELASDLPVRAPPGTLAPMWLTPSARVGLARGLYLFGSLELALAGRADQGMPAPSPWLAQFGLSSTFAPFGKNTVEIRKEVQVRKEVELRDREVVTRRARVTGVVLDEATGEPIPEATVAINGSGLSPVLTDEQGRFTTGELDAAERFVWVKSLTYEEKKVPVRIPASGDLQVEVRLAPLSDETMGALQAEVVDHTGAPAQAVLSLPRARGLDEREFLVDGARELQLPPGPYYAEFRADGRLVTGRQIVVPRGGQVPVRIQLSAPDAPRATVSEEKIQITDRIQFEFDSDVLLESSYSVLDSVVDVLLTHPEMRIRIEGHTDEVGTSDFNLNLSQRRAKSVIAYLVEHGVAEDRLQPVGHGATKPLAQNDTEENRATNRRVEFVIVDDARAEVSNEVIAPVDESVKPQPAPTE